MRPFLAFLLFAACLIAGCNKPATQPSATAPFTVKTSEKAEPAKIELESGTIDVQKGKSTKIVIRANRKDSKAETMFKGDIKVEFDTSDAKGLKIDAATIPAGQESVEVTVTAAADAAGGMVGVTGKGEGVQPFMYYIQATVR